MKILTTLLLLSISILINAQTKRIHVFVALCDNEHQGIVPVPKTLGNGKDARNNLYWGAAYGLKSFLKYKTDDWVLLKSIASNDSSIIERVLFKHKTKKVYLLADAYDGELIKKCNEDFLKASNHQNPLSVNTTSQPLSFGGDANLVCYIGHDGLMDFGVNIKYTQVKKPKDIMILACYSKSYYSPEIKKAGATPLLWTTHLMAPEAYTLKAAIDGWMLQESGEQIEERAAQAYNKYQKCGIKGAINLMTTGF